MKQVQTKGELSLSFLLAFISLGLEFEFYKGKKHYYVANNHLLVKIPKNKIDIKTNVKADEEKFSSVFQDAKEFSSNPVYINKNHLKKYLTNENIFQEDYSFDIYGIEFLPVYIKVIHEISELFNETIMADIKDAIKPSMFYIGNVVEFALMPVAPSNYESDSIVIFDKNTDTRSHDQKLIDQALNAGANYMFNIEQLKKQAQSEETVKRLDEIMNSKYHREEYFANNL